ncbi:MAG: tetratricopeptide repeat protein [Verrucomicrobia bacterium]|nr:tetratricopeptide repeat protein [Verrucomicrobiota bacterium]
MKRLVIGWLSLLLVASQMAAATNASSNKSVVALSLPVPNDPVEKEYQKLLAEDDAAQAEVDKWIRENKEFAEQGAGISSAALNQRIKDRFTPVRKAYEEFLQRHPDHAHARLAFGSFLNDLQEEEAARDQWEKASELEPGNPAAWNNLANNYSEHGPIKKAFEYYARAIELKPDEALYHHNLGMTVHLFRRAAMEFYNLSEQQVFEKALALYRQALKLDPNNFPFASDVAQTYYGLKPTRTEDALKAWNDALKIANDDIEREGVYLHLARFKLDAARFAEARQQLLSVTNAMYTQLKSNLLQNINAQEARAKQTNAPPAAVEKQ